MIRKLRRTWGKIPCATLFKEHIQHAVYMSFKNHLSAPSEYGTFPKLLCIPQGLRGMLNNICFFNHRTIQVSLENCPVPVYTEASIMFNWAVIFLIISIIAAFLGFGGVAGTAAEAAKVVFVVGLILFVASLVMGRLRR